MNPWDTTGVKHSHIEDIYQGGRTGEILPGGFVVDPSQAEDLVVALRKFNIEVNL
jgi:hypothetical protein